MLLATVPIPPTPDFWQQAVRALLREGQPLGQALQAQQEGALDFSGVQLMVPAFSHAQNFKAALSRELRRPYIAPRINTLSGLLAMQPPGESCAALRERAAHAALCATARTWLAQENVFRPPQCRPAAAGADAAVLVR